jgi:hypothetical protein
MLTSDRDEHFTRVYMYCGDPTEKGAASERCDWRSSQAHRQTFPKGVRQTSYVPRTLVLKTRTRNIEVHGYMGKGMTHS